MGRNEKRRKGFSAECCCTRRDDKLNDGEETVYGRIYMTFVEPIDINELSALDFDNERIEF